MDEDDSNVAVGNRRIVPCRFADEIVDGARRLHAGKAAARNHERQQLAAGEFVRLQRHRFHTSGHHPLTN